MYVSSFLMSFVLRLSIHCSFLGRSGRCL